jgi:hypothetical protein
VAVKMLRRIRILCRQGHSTRHRISTGDCRRFFSPRGRRKHSAELIQVGNEFVEPAPPMRLAAGIRRRMSDERTI